MKNTLLNSITTSKYERILPRVFPGASTFSLRDQYGELIWKWPEESDQDITSEGEATVSKKAWSELAAGLFRRELANGELQFRSPVMSRESGRIGWLVVTFDLQKGVPLTAAPDKLRRAFADTMAFLHEDIEMQSECNQLALELTERYEELNLVYQTNDQVEYFEEGQEALSNLVHNCTDYLNVDYSALICRERNLTYTSSANGIPNLDSKQLLEILSTGVYDCVEAQLKSVIINEEDDANRERVFGGQRENLLAYPIVDDHSNVIGIIAVVARGKSHVFSNGDRNLLEVMAKKAARIINTHHDSLTGLMNRRGFEPSMVAALATAHSRNQQYSLLHVDVDQLHVINDLLGHQEGDVLIRRVSKVLRNELRDSDSLARLGSDEFAVLLPNCSPAQAHSVAEKIRAAIHRLQVISANKQLDVSVSIGISAIEPTTESIVSVMASAEIACTAAKESGRDRVQIFEPDNTTLVRRSEEVEWVGRVQEALRRDRMILHCQPVLSATNPSVEPHYEILVRMRGDDDEVLPPNAFLPAAERYQLMPQIDRWVITSSIQTLDAVWEEIGDVNAVFCINLSGQSLTNPGFEKFVSDTLQSASVPAENLCFEVTETAAISNLDEALHFIAAIKDLGCRFSLDDFGAGLSSFGYLKMLPVDYLKIDGSFVKEITTDRVSRSMVEAICGIGRTMGLSTVAEYVGDEETVGLLQSIGVDYLQGFHIGKPIPLDDVIADLLKLNRAAIA